MAKETRVNTLVELHERFGQSPWLDSISRDLLTSGKLQDWVSNHGLRGLTSNPSIFDKAMTQSNAYDAQLDRILAQGDRDVKEIYEELAIADIQAAADILRSVYDSSRGRDGFVSIEVSPNLARDTRGTIDEAQRLWNRIGRPNLMVKVPATNEGIPAIRHLIADGLNVNITLLFSREMYGEVADAYIEGLEDRLAAGKSIEGIASVASFFVSRIDSLTDKTLGGLKDPRAAELKGKIAIANAKLAYVHYQEVIESPRWKNLAGHGAQPQRLLWASTSTKNPAYRDVLYVEGLIGPDTVNTMPLATMSAFEAHGELRATLTDDIDGAKRIIKKLADVNISLNAITDDLTQEGIRLFVEPFDALMLNLERKKRRKTQKLNSVCLHLPIPEMTAVGEALRDWRTTSKIRRLWARDSSLWTGKDESRWLGWLSAVRDSLSRADDLEELRSEFAASGARDIVLLGMGGSSLAPEVFDTTFNSDADRPDLHVLDSTSPEQISHLERQVDPAQSFFIVSSKSGTTLEPNVFLDYFYTQVEKARGENAGKRFVAITDPGSPLERVARARGFLNVFHGNPEIGGRYSALSAFGLVPASLIGVDIQRFLRRAEEMVHSCSENVPPEENPGVILGAVLGALGNSGRDKVTLICSPEIGDLGAWLEQLLAESTGKSGKGLIPVSEERVGTPDSYGDDRLFVYLKLQGSQFGELDRAVELLEIYGHPVVKIEVEGTYTLGQEFFRWELATAVAGSILGINPFDQPDVEASKIETQKLVKLPQPNTAEALQIDLLRAHLELIRPHDYFALLAYVEMNLANEDLLQEIREMVRSTYRVATCLGFGPRFLHSTGQAYKGGPDSGVFLQITSSHAEDLSIPGHALTFGQVQNAQAQGDFRVLTDRHRRCLRIHLPADQAAGLVALRDAVRQALIRPSSIHAKKGAA
jgi:transaldolase/glucose-6-phosphate isomerase